MKDCTIIRDLMPNYIDNLTSEETNVYIEKHLENCEDCKNYYNKMKSQITLENEDSIKQQIDYMKKVKKKMNTAKRLLTIIFLLCIILVMIFWRDIYNLICYADICSKYLVWQDEVYAAGGYYEYMWQGNSEIINYFTKGKMVSLTTDSGIDSIDSTIDALVLEEEFENKTAMYTYRYGGESNDFINKGYVNGDKINKDVLEMFPEETRFNLEEKVSFWELMSTFSKVRYIYQIFDEGDNVKYYVINMQDGSIIKVNKGTGVVEEAERASKILIASANMVTEEKLVNFPENMEDKQIILHEFDGLEESDKSVPTKPVSNTNSNPGEIVSYDFKIRKEDNQNLDYFWVEEENKNLLKLKITNNEIYRSLQKRWRELRDLTDEDFEHYFVIIVIDKNNTKELKFENYGDEDNGVAMKNKLLNFSEVDASDEFIYSGSVIIIPNFRDYSVGYTQLHSNTNLFTVRVEK